MRSIESFKWNSPLKHLIITTAGEAYNLISIDTLKVLGITLPLYAIARLYDSTIHTCFFCNETKKNINQYPSIYHIIHEGFIATTVGVSLYGLWRGIQKDPSWYCDATGSVVCILSVWGIKNIIKCFEHEGSLRPFDEKHAPIIRKHGGFPSGHMSMISSMATYWWKRRGPALGIPFTCFAAGAFVSLVNVNRHYLSQVVAGAGLGTIIGLACSKAVDFLKNICEDVRCGASYDVKKKEASLTFECSF